MLHGVSITGDGAGRANLPSSVPVTAVNIVVQSKTNLFSCTAPYISADGTYWVVDVMISDGSHMGMGMNRTILVDISYFDFA